MKTQDSQQHEESELAPCPGYTALGYLDQIPEQLAVVKCIMCGRLKIKDDWIWFHYPGQGAVCPLCFGKHEDECVPEGEAADSDHEARLLQESAFAAAPGYALRVDVAGASLQIIAEELESVARQLRHGCTGGEGSMKATYLRFALKQVAHSD